MKITTLFIASLTSLFIFSCNYKTDKAVKTAQQETSQSQLIQKIAKLKEAGYEIVDYHAHLKGGLTMEELLDHSKKTGIDYGVAFNAGLGFPITNDSTLLANYEQYKEYPVFMAMQAEGRECVSWTDTKGRRMRLWMPEEVFIDDRDDFMDQLVNQIVGVMTNEPIDLYVNSTFLPDVLQPEYDALWTIARMDKVINAAVTNNIAVEINARYKIPSSTFIKRAKAAGAKFSMGTNNTGKELGTLDYAIEMIEVCGLEPKDFFKPVVKS
jgi:hypothetical protein